VYGSGKINWQSDGARFRIDGEAGVLFFTVFNFSSEGTVSDNGIEPVLYTEKRFRKSATNTHFHRERNTISFSASTVSYPRQGGEQDRASIAWQLAGIGRADAGVFAPDAEIDPLPVPTTRASTSGWHRSKTGIRSSCARPTRMATISICRCPA
jgi:hypothetical protein